MIELEVNGVVRRVDVPPLTPLVDVLRRDLALTGAKAPCREGFCGACTVLIDDAPVVSCLVPVGDLGTATVRTVESLAPGDGPLCDLQQALLDDDAVQCGMCFPGMLMTLTAMQEGDGVLDREDVRRGLVGNVCRCTGYERIVEAAARILTPDPGDDDLPDGGAGVQEGEVGS